MSNITENLERYFNSFIDQQNDWAFFLGLSDYVGFIINTPEIEKFIILINSERKTEEVALQKLGEETIKETELAKEKLLKIIKDNDISFPRLTNEIEEYENHKNGKIIGISEPLPSSLGECLNDIIWALLENNYKELIKDFIDEKGNITKHDFSKKLNLYEELRRKHKEREKTTLWGAWGYLWLVYISILKKDEELEKLKNDKTQWWTMINLKGVFCEMKKIEEGSLDRAIQFKKENYKSYSSRIHNHLIKELSQPAKDNFTNFSLENLIKVQKVLKIVLDELELQDINELVGNKVPIKKFEKEDILLSEAEAILDKMDCVKVIDWKPPENEFYNQPYFPLFVSKKDANENLFICVYDLGVLKETAEETNNKIKEKEPENKNQIERAENKKTEKTILYLYENGELYREKHCYPIKENSDRYKIIKHFSENKLYDYSPTNSITSDLGLEHKNFGKVVGVINQIAKGKLKIRDKIIEGKKGSGYRINPKYKIIIK